jgi:hypothetical protein
VRHWGAEAALTVAGASPTVCEKFFIYLFIYLCFLRFICFAPASGALEVPQHVRISSATCRNCRAT